MTATRTVAVTMAFALVAAACGGGTSDDATPPATSTPPPATEAPGSGGPAQTVTSADGVVELSIPAGAVDAATEITITAAAAPAELAVDGFELQVYELAPSGLRFSTPAGITMRLPSSGDAALPLVFVAVEDDSGAIEQLPADVFIDGTGVVIESEIEHFSWLALWVSGDEVPIHNGCPDTMVVGESCEVSVEIPSYGEPDASLSFTVGFPAQPYFQVAEGPRFAATYTCTAATDSPVEAIVVDLHMPARALFNLFEAVGAIMKYPSASDHWSQYVSCAEPEPGAVDFDPTGGIPGAVVAEASDPEGDFLTAEDLSTFPRLEENPPAGIDITDVAVAYAPGGDQTVITVCFAGSFLDLEADETRRLVLRPIFRRDGSYNFEIEYLGGGAFVSGGPEGASVEMNWIAGNKVQFILSGFAPIPADAVRIDVFTEKGSGDEKAVQGDRADVDITE